MGVFDQSSSPLSTLFPNKSPFKLPDYNNFSANLTLPDKGLQFRVGQILSKSNNYSTSIQGKQLMQDAAKTPSLQDSLQSTDITPTKLPVDYNKMGSYMSMASDILNPLMPLKSEYSGSKGSIALGLDSAYNQASNAVMQINPLVGGIMKGAGVLSKGVNAIGGGTSGMTTTDAILGSSFLSLTPLGLINGFGGTKTDTITRDDEAFSQVGGSYTGSSNTVNDALTKSGKKYGLLSSGARRKADRLIFEAKRLQGIISDIADDTYDDMTLKTTMSAINNNRYGLQMQGGYNLSAIRVGKHGMLLQRVRDIIKALNGIKIPFNVWKLGVNPDYDSSNYDLEAAYKYLPIEQLNKWKWATNSKDPDFYMNYKDKNGKYPYHLSSVAPIGEDYIFLKKGTEKTNPEVHLETDTYYDGSNGLKSTHNLVYEGDRYYYRKKKATPKHLNGGSIIELINESVIDLVDPNDIPEFKQGGSVNVIPDGALHARKHNMDVDNITEKGIPVVSEALDGKIKQLAEIEKEEIIFRLKVTLKLEALEKKYYNDETSLKEKDELAIEAGKLITEEILHNTKDNVGIL